ncbi:MAG: acyltransferase family protein [Capsulimonadaceae bacterium]
MSHQTQNDPIVDAAGSETPSEPRGRDKASHVSYLDGMRGTAAFCIVLFHCQLLSRDSVLVPWRPGFADLIPRCFEFSHFAVPVFIVLSGYCLMHPVASHGLELRGGVMGFMKRRARRILPPYYAALALALLIHWQFYRPSGVAAPSLVLHLLMLHNLSLDYCKTIDGPMWSVATEWDIYLVFAVLFLPALRRFGWGAVAVMSVVIGFLPHILLPVYHNFDWVAPWFVGGFAMGMLAATLTQPGMKRGIASVLFKPLAAVAVAVVIAGLMLYSLIHHLGAGVLGPLPDCAADTLVEVLATLLILQASQGESRLRSLFESKPFVAFGEFSYSVYLVHQVMLEFFITIARDILHFDTQQRFLSALLIMPMIIVISYVFHRLFERPFLNWRPQALP